MARPEQPRKRDPAEIARLIRVLSERLSQDPDFIRESEDLQRRIEAGEPSPTRISPDEIERWANGKGLGRL